ncbi:MAG: MFS transporter [Deltaproteobacteria bacterium]|nr:MFS transporter [Deltaproteobacteria bacterium]MCB9786280.1 MFS transporter [Deltaproteobacteria bacterium]
MTRPPTPATSPRPVGTVAFRLLYLLIFFVIGGFANFVPLWLRDAGWDEPSIGWLTAVRACCILAFPLAWGRLSDRIGDSVVTVRIIAVGSFLAFSALIFTTAHLPVTLAVGAFALFWVGLIPNVDATVLAQVHRTGEAYSAYRVWGSVGFIAGGFALGALIEGWGTRVTPAALTGALAALALLALRLRPQPRSRTTHGRGLAAVRSLLANPYARGICLVAFASRVSAQGLYIFLPHHLRDLGVRDGLIPTFWAVGVLSEIVLMRAAPLMLERLGVRALTAICCAAGALQFGLIAVLDDPWWVLPVMALHGMSFGVWYVVSILSLGRHVPESERATAQGLFQMIGYGLGGLISAIGAGYLYGAGRGPLMFGVAAILGLVTAAMAFLVMPRDPVSPATPTH